MLILLEQNGCTKHSFRISISYHDGYEMVNFLTDLHHEIVQYRKFQPYSFWLRTVS